MVFVLQADNLRDVKLQTGCAGATDGSYAGASMTLRRDPLTSQPDDMLNNKDQLNILEMKC